MYIFSGQNQGIQQTSSLQASGRTWISFPPIITTKPQPFVTELRQLSALQLQRIFRSGATDLASHMSQYMTITHTHTHKHTHTHTNKHTHTAPSNTPTKVTTTTVKVAKDSPIPKPPPPAIATMHVGGQQQPTCKHDQLRLYYISR